MFKDSYILQQISVSSGKSMSQLLEELERREQYIKDMFTSGVENQREVAEKILSYYNNQREEKEELKEKQRVPEVIEELDNTDTSDLHSLIDYAKKQKPTVTSDEIDWENVENLLNEIKEENT
jgi:hypothetical protein